MVWELAKWVVPHGCKSPKIRVTNHLAIRPRPSKWVFLYLPLKSPCERRLPSKLGACEKKEPKIAGRRLLCTGGGWLAGLRYGEDGAVCSGPVKSRNTGGHALFCFVVCFCWGGYGGGLATWFGLVKAPFYVRLKKGS